MSRYAEAHKRDKIAGPGDARPTALQIIHDENLINALSDKTFLITGVSSGIGIETLRALQATGAHCYGTVRNLRAGQSVVSSILTSNPSGGKIDLIEMDLSDLTSVRRGASSFLSQSGGNLNLIVANAGVMACRKGKTVDGFETQFGTNHLGHFLLFQLLKDVLLSSASPAYPSRVVSVTSWGHRMGSVRFHDYHFENEEYNEWTAYGQSKTANLWFANALERKFGGRDLHATSVHPGGITTGLVKHIDKAYFDSLMEQPELQRYYKSVEQGAASQVFAAVGKEWMGKGGRYLSDCVVQPPFGTQGVDERHDDGYAAWAYDEEGEERLWRESLEMVGVEEV
ncbi:short-chain dehydrogenase [Lophiostoma macrostomum CBS 122681]|uniref:Short-chain dehydrogenase n=1 Tax=Lophiostoma macrostomum CBS 122681 TaxID=1314788 RepID=A0A6A6T8H1_9PLEO|nr:short-chain dehydrogenase [Lophiostoma macrostomum CBS 122681]